MPVFSHHLHLFYLVPYSFSGRGRGGRGGGGSRFASRDFRKHFEDEARGNSREREDTRGGWDRPRGGGGYGGGGYGGGKKLVVAVTLMICMIRLVRPS